jgi:hypothetical protein
VTTLAFITLALLTLLWCLFELPFVQTVDDRLGCWGLMLTGPVGVIFYRHLQPGACCFLPCISMLLVAAIAAHPIKPNAWTGIITVLGWLAWFFLGFAAVASIV